MIRQINHKEWIYLSESHQIESCIHISSRENSLVWSDFSNAPDNFQAKVEAENIVKRITLGVPLSGGNSQIIVVLI